MVRVVAAAALAVATIACGSTLRETNGQAGAGGRATATPISTPSPAPAIRRPSGTVAPGYVRLTDDRGGWSIDIPADWNERPGAQHGRVLRNYDPTIPLPGNFSSEFLPPTGGVYVLLRMQQNPERRDAPSFFAPAANTPGFEVREHRSLTLGGQPAEFWSTWRSQPAEAQRLEPTLSWYVRSPYFQDRMVVITAAPGESPLRPQIERIVASLQFYQPAPVDLTPTVTRREAIKHAAPPTRAGKPTSYTRVAAKLVLYKDWERAMSGGQSFTTDPDTLVWVVAYTGTGITTRRGDTCVWGLSVFAARALEPANNVGAFACGNDPWPKSFDQLVDLDK